MAAHTRAPTGAHAVVAEGPALVVELEASRDRLRGQALRAVGIAVGSATDESRAERDVGWKPLIGVGALGAIFELQRWALFAFAPEIAATMGVTSGAMSFVNVLGNLILGGSLFAVVALVHRTRRRASWAVAGGVIWSITILLASLVTTTGALLVAIVGAAASKASAGALHRPMLTDAYPPHQRGMVLALYRGAQGLGAALAVGVATVGSRVAGLSWRGTMLCLGQLAVLGAATAWHVRDPSARHQDADRVRRVVDVDGRLDDDARTGDGVDDDDALTVGELFRSLRSVSTLGGLLAGYVVIGMSVAPLHTYVFFFLEERWHMGAGSRGAFFAVAALVGALAVIAIARYGGRLFAESPERALRLTGTFLVAGAVCVAAGSISPRLGLTLTLVTAGFAFFLIALPGLDMAVMTLVRDGTRPAAAAVTEGASVLLGGVLGTFLFAAIESRFGFAPAFVAFVLPALGARLAIGRAASAYRRDLHSTVDSMIEETEIRLIRLERRRPPLLACRHLDFAYGQLQVLFEVNFTVDDGEMVALLGTNGAGKSTLLRAISGLATPSRGSLRFDGADITHFGAERRVDLGIIQVAGGKAVFGPLSVMDNMRLHAYTLGRDRASVERAIDDVFAAFPALAGRRDQLASTLSGGEQQMLALGKALILKPRLLLIDELSLGLAPVVVGELLEMVRQIRDNGAAVVLVEQSVNVALTLADHAYFMEKGEIRFDGPSSMLLERDDLLRSVFLEGAATGMAVARS